MHTSYSVTINIQGLTFGSIVTSKVSMTNFILRDLISLNSRV